jgi:pilus assembly protein FimV
MSSGKNPLMLMMALSVPSAAHALGLGDIHVDSALNERLAAEIDIVGATPLELTDLRAAVANRETFLRYGADRPGFLSSTTFKVAQDSHGRPVLAVRSTESFTEPLVNFVVDLRWSHGELVRQYTLLLDPPGFASVAPAPAAAAVVPVATNAPAATSIPATHYVPATAAVAGPVVETTTRAAASQVDPPSDQPDPTGAERAARKTTHVKVGAKATLRGVAWRVGERTESDLQRMMVAIFRANPSAFDGNINRLHRGAVLTIPSHEEVAAISTTEAQREVHQQMAAWRSRANAAAGAMAANHLPAASVPATTTSVVAAVAGPSSAAAIPGGASNESDSPGTGALGRRVQSLEQELSEMKGLLESEQNQLIKLRQQEVRAGESVPAAIPHAAKASQATNAPRAQPKAGYGALVPIVSGLGLLGAALAALYVRLRRRAPALKVPRNDGVAAAADAPGVDATAGDAAARDAARDAAGDAAHYAATTEAVIGYGVAVAETETGIDDHDATHPMLPAIPTELAERSEFATGAVAPAVPQDPTVNLHVDTVNLRIDPTRLDYNFLDLDLTAQHVQMPSVLNQHAVVKERRTNLADVLKLAIEREPDRHDLRMKLLELYYSAAATNRKAFLEVVQKFARERDYLKTEQWDKIAYMGRQIASENPMFTDESAADDDLADCA